MIGITSHINTKLLKFFDRSSVFLLTKCFKLSL